MADLKQLPAIDTNSDTWFAVQKWVESELARLRGKREELDADLRKLDLALGSILALELIESLPQRIRDAQKPTTVESETFNIPVPKGY